METNCAPCVQTVILHSFEKINNYKGCSLEGREFIFHFSNLTFEEELLIGRIIENQIVGRLGHKALLSYEGEIFRAFLSNPDDYADYLASVLILDDYFRGKKPSLRLMAENRVFLAGKDWRNKTLLKQEEQKLFEKENYRS